MSTENDSPAPAPTPDSGGRHLGPLVTLEGDSGSSSRRQMISEVPARSRSNIRRSAPGVRLFYLLFFIVLGITAAAYWIYVSEIKPALAKAPSATAELGGSPAVVRAVEVQLPTEFRNELASASSQIVELKQQLESFRSLQSAHEQQMDSIKDRLVSLPSAPAPLSTTESAGVLTLAPSDSAFEATTDSPTQAELRLLKERNRLTAYADEAISTGSRRPLQLIIEAMKDPARATLYHAGKAEYYRVVGHFHLMNRIDPGYQLPIKTLLPGQDVRDEADLTTELLLGLLANQDHDWQVRLRAAFLLGGRRTLEVGEALLAAMKNDPSLDVVKEAQLSFQQNMERTFLLFDFPAIESWWETQTIHRPAAEPNP